MTEPITLEYMEALAKELGPEWKARYDPTDGDMVKGYRGEIHYIGNNPDLSGAYIYCWNTRVKDKWQWSGYYRDHNLSLGRYVPYGNISPFSLDINVNPSRGASIVARELKKRLLPHFLSGYTVAMQNRRQIEEATDEANNLGHAFSNLFKTEDIRLEPAKKIGDECIVSTKKPPYITMRISKSFVRFEHFSLNHEQAESLINLISSWF